MAVTQISRIQHRRGLQQDLPQLSSAELGWSLDTRQLYIGNGTLEEGAPTVGVTRILTEYDVDEFNSNLDLQSYTFKGEEAGYTVQTGVDVINTIIRTVQDKFDDFVNVRDFGAVGDGTTDDTDSINRALTQIYKATVSPTEPRARRTIYFPGGTYKILNPIVIPTYARLIGDGLGSTTICQVNGNRSVANIADSLFQTGSSIGTNSATLPTDIEIHGINFFNSNTSITEPLMRIDSASNIKITSSKFVSNSAAGSYPNLVSIASTTSSTSKIIFDSCQLTGGGNGISIIGSSVASVRVLNCAFDNQANTPAHIGTSLGFVSFGNYFDSPDRISFLGNNYNISLGDYGQNLNYSGLMLGNLQHSTTVQYPLTTTPLVLDLLSNSSVKMNYEIVSGSNARSGIFSYYANGSSVSYSDDYIETTNSVGATLSANTALFSAQLTSGTAILKYNFTRFI